MIVTTLAHQDVTVRMAIGRRLQQFKTRAAVMSPIRVYVYPVVPVHIALCLVLHLVLHLELVAQMPLLVPISMELLKIPMIVRVDPAIADLAPVCSVNQR